LTLSSMTECDHLIQGRSSRRLPANTSITN